MRIRKYYKYIPMTLLALVAVYIQVNTDLMLPGYMADIINEGIVKMDKSTIYSIGSKMILVTLIGMIATIIVSYIAARVSSGVSRDLRNDVFEKIEGYSLNEFDKFSTASLITRNTNDIQQIQMLIFMVLRMVLSAPITAVIGIKKAIDTQADISWILAVSIPLALVFIFSLILVLAPKFTKVQKLTDRLNLVSRETLTGVRVIRAFNNEKVEEERFDDANRTLTKTNLFLNRMMVLMMPVTFMILDFTQLAVVWFGAKAIGPENMEVGNIMAFINYAMQVMFSFLMISVAAIQIPRALVSTKRVKEVLKTKPQITDDLAKKDNKEDERASVVFDDVSFSYPGADEKVLNNINFEADAGKVTAIIGSTGCGKSTLINLIPRFYDVTGGEIRVNGVNIKNYTQEALHNKIGYVSQKAVMFSGTIDSNIRLGDADATEDDIKYVADIAQATEFIDSKDEGYQSEVTQGGTNLSGGQKQRLSIARALARKAQIYIFDDSFSALDFKTDKALRRKLAPYTKDAVTFIVAQRISSIMDADQIIVLDEGEIVGKGTHKELLNNCDVYKEIAMSQLSKEELANG